MTDRELLELSAKASGVFLTPESLASIFPKWAWGEEFESFHTPDGMCGAVVVYDDSGEPSGTTRELWNPLTDDGDALRLAVRLRIRCEPMDGYGVAYAGGRCAEMFTERHGLAINEAAAQRRAIVRAAAAMGKAAAGQGTMMDELLDRLRNKEACSASEANRWMAEAADALEALSKDAERYRWLRSRFDACAACCDFAQDDDGKVWRNVEQNIDAGMILDAQIDAARAAVGAV